MRRHDFGPLATCAPRPPVSQATPGIYCALEAAGRRREPALALPDCDPVIATPSWRDECFDTVGLPAPFYVSDERDESGAALLVAHRSAATVVLRFAGVGVFAIDADSVSIYPESSRSLVETYLRGPVHAVALEMAGTPVLHASVVAWGGSAAAFLGPSHAGKSTLAAAALSKCAHLVSDDLLALVREHDRWSAARSDAGIRLWPDDAGSLSGSSTAGEALNDWTPKRRLSAADLCGESVEQDVVPLAAIYLLERGADMISTAPLGLADAAFALVTNSFCPRLVEAAGIQGARMAMLADVVKSVPVRRLSYPDGHEALGAVLELVAGQVEGG